MHRIRLILALILPFLSPDLHGESFVSSENSGVADFKTQYGAKGDGATEDTEAVKKAVEENRMRQMYFPDGACTRKLRPPSCRGSAREDKSLATRPSRMWADTPAIQ